MTQTAHDRDLDAKVERRWTHDRVAVMGFYAARAGQSISSHTAAAACNLPVRRARSAVHQLVVAGWLRAVPAPGGYPPREFVRVDGDGGR